MMNTSASCSSGVGVVLAVDEPRVRPQTSAKGQSGKPYPCPFTLLYTLSPGPSPCSVDFVGSALLPLRLRCEIQDRSRPSSEGQGDRCCPSPPSPALHWLLMVAPTGAGALRMPLCPECITHLSGFDPRIRRTSSLPCQPKPLPHSAMTSFKTRQPS